MQFFFRLLAGQGRVVTKKTELILIRVAHPDNFDVEPDLDPYI